MPDKEMINTPLSRTQTTQLSEITPLTTKQDPKSALLPSGGTRGVTMPDAGEETAAINNAPAGINNAPVLSRSKSNSTPVGFNLC